MRTGCDGGVKVGYEGAGGAKKQGCFEVGKTVSKECFWVAQGFSLAIRSLYQEGLLAAEVLMVIPYRGRTGPGTYFITASTCQRKHLFQAEPMARLFVDVLLHYRTQGKYSLHEFVLMPDHFHLLITPAESLERALQLIKGGFSFRAKKELGFGGEVWEKSFYDHRVRDLGEYGRFRDYIRKNPVKRGLAAVAEDYSYGSAAGFVMDEVPQRLKPVGCLA